MSLKSRRLWSLVRLAVLNYVTSIWEGLSVSPIVPREGEPGEGQNPVLRAGCEHPPQKKGCEKARTWVPVGSFPCCDKVGPVSPALDSCHLGFQKSVSYQCLSVG